MVNYCCVPGCLRNSGKHPNLTFFSLPKDPERQEKWLQAIGKEELMSSEMEKTRLIKRFCSRHFTTLHMTKRHMMTDAVPTLYLTEESNTSDSETKQDVHPGIACNACGQQIFGFRYMCLACPDFDLCHKCEANEAHPDHLVVRLPKPVHFTKARKIARKCQRVFGTDPISISNQSDKSDDQSDMSDDSDDAPITKYRSDELDLTVAERIMIQKEIERALKVPMPEVKELNPVRRRRNQITHGSQMGIFAKKHTPKTVSHVACQTDLPFEDYGDIELNMKQERPRKELEVNPALEVQRPVVAVKRPKRKREVMVEIEKMKKENVVTTAKKEESVSGPVSGYGQARSALDVTPTEDLDSAALAELSEFIIIPQRN